MTRLTIHVPDARESLMERTPPRVTAAVQDLAAAVARGADKSDELDALARTLGEVGAVVDLLARYRVRLWTRNLEQSAHYALPNVVKRALSWLWRRVAGVPAVPFREAVADIVSREPRLVSSVDEVADVYRAHGFTMAKATDVEVVRKVQGLIAQSIELGTTRDRVTWVVESMGDWNRAYADLVYANATANAYTAGTFRELRDPDVAEVIPVLGGVIAGDSNTRPNHRPLERLFAAPQDPVWHACAPPNGHRCRCGTRFVTSAEARQRGVLDGAGRVASASVPSGFFRDHGFSGGRPDVAIYGG